MTPQEKQLLDNLFAQIRSAATLPRDTEVEAILSNFVQSEPHAVYVLAQNNLLQQQALQLASQKIDELTKKLNELSQSAPAQPSVSFLGGAVASIVPIVPPSSAPPQQSTGSWGQTSAPPPSHNPWGQMQASPISAPISAPMSAPMSAPSAFSPWGTAPQSGSFLSGALSTAAGVAGGVLMADAIGSMLSHHTQSPNSPNASLMPSQSPDNVMDQISDSFERDGSASSSRLFESEANDFSDGDQQSSDFDQV